MDLNKILKIGSRQVDFIKDFIRKQNRPLPLEVLIDRLCDTIKVSIAENLTFKIYDPRNNYFEGDNIYWEKNNFFGRVIDRRISNREHDLIEVLWDTQLSGPPAESYLRKNKNVRMFYLINSEGEPGEVHSYRLETRRKIAESQIDYDSLAFKLLSFLKIDNDFVTWGGKWFLKGLIKEFASNEIIRAIDLIEKEIAPFFMKDIIDEVFCVNEKSTVYPSIHFSLSYLFSTMFRHRVAYLSPLNDGEWSSYAYIQRKLPKLPDFISKPRISETCVAPYISRDYYHQDLKYIYDKEHGRFDSALNKSPLVKEHSVLPRVLGFWEYQTGMIVLSNLERAYFPRQYKLVFVDQHTKKEFNCFYDFSLGYIAGLDKWIALHMIPGGEMEFRDLGYGNKFELRWRQSKTMFHYSPLRYAIASDELIEDGTKVVVACGVNKNFFVDEEDYGELKDLFAIVRNPKIGPENIVHELFTRFGPKIKIEKLATYYSVVAGPWVRTCLASCSSVLSSDTGFIQGRGEKGNGIFHYDEEKIGKPELANEYDLIQIIFPEMVSAENENPYYVGDEADLRVILRDYGYWIRLKDQAAEKARVEERKERVQELRKIYFKKTFVKKSSDTEIIEILKTISDEFMDVPIITKSLDPEKISSIRKAIGLILETSKGSSRRAVDNLLSIIDLDGKLHVDGISESFFFRIAQIHDPTTFMGINHGIETKLEKIRLKTWKEGASPKEILIRSMELVKTLRRVRSSYDSIDLEHILHFTAEINGPVYLDSILNSIFRERAYVASLDEKRAERLQMEKKKREMKKLTEEVEKARKAKDKAVKEPTAAKLGKISAEAAPAAVRVSVSVFEKFENLGLNFESIGKFLKPQLSKRLTKIHTSLKLVRPVTPAEAEGYANTLYWYWIDWLWKFIVQQANTLQINVDELPELPDTDRKTLGIIGGIRALMVEEGLDANFDEVKYLVIKDLKSMVLNGGIILRNYEMTDFTGITKIEKKSEEKKALTKEEKAHAAEFTKFCKKVQECVKCPMIPNIKCNVFNDGADGMGKVIARGIPNRAVAADSTFILGFVGATPETDRSGYLPAAKENFFTEILKGSSIPLQSAVGIFAAKCSALGDKPSRTMLSNCQDWFVKEVQILKPAALIIANDEVTRHYGWRKGEWLKWKGLDVYCLKNSGLIGMSVDKKDDLLTELDCIMKRFS